MSYPKGEVSRFTNDLTNYNTCCLAVTRDGDALVALQNVLLSDVWVAKADGSDARQVTSGEAMGQGLAIDQVHQRRHVCFFGSVQESDRARDFSGVGFTSKTDAVAAVAVGMWKSRVWCGFPSSVGWTTTFW